MSLAGSLWDSSVPLMDKGGSAESAWYEMVDAEHMGQSPL